MLSDILITMFVYSGLIVLMTIWNRKRTQVVQPSSSSSSSSSSLSPSPSGSQSIERADAAEKEFFLGGRTIRTYLAFLSVVASETSVATVIIFPQIGYAGHLNLIWLPIGYIFWATDCCQVDIARYLQVSSGIHLCNGEPESCCQLFFEHFLFGFKVSLQRCENFSGKSCSEHSIRIFGK